MYLSKSRAFFTGIARPGFALTLGLAACGAPARETEQPLVAPAPAPTAPKKDAVANVAPSASSAVEQAKPPEAPPPPIRVEVVPLVTLGDSTCSAGSDGTWRCWGSAKFGALGSAAKPETCGTKLYPGLCVKKPVKLEGVEAAVLAGDSEAFCALRSDGQLACWGVTKSGMLGGLTGDHDCIIESGKLVPRCEDSAKERHCTDPKAAYFSCVEKPTPIPGLGKVRSIVAGSRFFCALGDAGPTCWGDNNYGRTGTPPGRDEPCEKLPANTFVVGGAGCVKTPRLIEGLPPIAKIAAGGAFGAALTKDGHVITWGSNLAGEQGRSIPGPNGEVSDLTGITDLALGHYTACALREKGALSCWGSHSQGEAGVGPREASEYGLIQLMRPEPIPGLTGVRNIAMSASSSHTCVVLADHRLACWGANDMGQLGIGDQKARSRPTLVSNLADVERVVVGDMHTCAALRSGAIMCFGANHLGQLGTSRAANRCKLPFLADASVVSCSTTPVAVEGL